MYINVESNHPPNITKQLPDSINRRNSDTSCNEDEFNKAKDYLWRRPQIQWIHSKPFLQQTQTKWSTKQKPQA